MQWILKLLIFFLCLQILKVHAFPSRRISSAIFSECSTFDRTMRLREMLQLSAQVSCKEMRWEVFRCQNETVAQVAPIAGSYLCRMVIYWVLTQLCTVSQHNRLTAALIKLVGACKPWHWNISNILSFPMTNHLQNFWGFPGIWISSMFLYIW